MSTPRLVEEFYQRIWNEGHLDAAGSCSRRTFRFVDPWETRCTDGKSSRIMFVLYVEPSPGISAKFSPVLAKETRPSQKMRFSGRHIAPFRGYEPTGKPVEWIGAALFRFEDGAIADLWVLGDLAGLDALLKAQAAERSSER